MMEKVVLSGVLKLYGGVYGGYNTATIITKDGTTYSEYIPDIIRKIGTAIPDIYVRTDYKEKRDIKGLYHLTFVEYTN